LPLAGGRKRRDVATCGWKEKNYGRFKGDLSGRIGGGRQNCGGGESDSARTGPLRKLWRPCRRQSSDRSNERLRHGIPGRNVCYDLEVDQNGSLATESLLQPRIINEVTSALDEQFVARTVLFPVFTRYFLARERSFQIMIEDLLKHRKTNQKDKPPLVLGADVPRLRHIANKMMGYLRATYRLFKDTVSETEKDSKALVKSHMQMCVKHYHAFLLQLDLFATRWGINVGRMRAKLASNKRMEAGKTAEERSQSQPERGPSEVV
jgi:hypothetical protein